MLGLFVILIASWGLIYLIERKGIDVIGIVPNKKRGIQFIYGLIFIVIIGLLNVYLETVFLEVNWKMQHDIEYKSIVSALIYHLRSALTEDLVFRGAILYLLIRKMGPKRAILISGLFFGIYHVFSYGMALNKIIPLLYVVLITGFTGYVWAYTFYKTKSIFMGLGFHLGVNLINIFFFEAQPFGEMLFTEVSRAEVSEWNNFLYLIFKGLFPAVLTFAFIKILYKKNVNSLLLKD